MSSNDSSRKKKTSLSLQEREDLIEKKRIYFYSDLERDKWPKIHSDIFEKIKELGNIRFEDYRKDIYSDESRPWRQQTKQRAETIVKIAQSCLKNRRNEPEWRLELEPEIFRRYKYEVDCRQCTGRFWRAEIEATEYSEDKFTTRLFDRQSKRTACTCPRQGPKATSEKLNTIFEKQFCTGIVYEESLQKKLLKKNEQPDAVYGLSRIGRIKSLLFTKDNRPESGGETIGKMIKTSPFPPDSPTLFPFLVSESKSAKAGVQQIDIESQMAFVIRNLLLLQESLCKATRTDNKWTSGPLVWCVSHRGNEWQVSAAFINNRQKMNHFVILQLWSGNIAMYDGAIRLILILDHIFDWARDVYREAIIAELKTLAVSTISTHTILDSDAASTITTQTVRSYLDQDFISNGPSVNQTHGLPLASRRKNEIEANIKTKYRHGGIDEEDDTYYKANSNDSNPIMKLNRIESWNLRTMSQMNHLHSSLGVPDNQDPFRRFDSYRGVLRDAKRIQSRLVGLYITDKNLHLLLNSRSKESESAHLLKRITTRLENEEPVFIDQETLTALELAWTGVDRGSLDFLNQDEEFQVLLTFSAYLTPSWEQTRELCYLAISRRAKELLLQSADKKRPFKGYLSPRISHASYARDAETIMKIVYFHLQATIHASLSACLYRCSLCPTFAEKGEEDEEEDDIFRGDEGRISCRMIPYSKEKSRDLVWQIYNQNRIGRNEPSTPYLRVSNRWDEQKLDQHKKSSPTAWTTIPISNSEMAILAESEDPKDQPSTSIRCIFLIDRAQLGVALADLLSRKKVFPYFFMTDRLGTETGWKRCAWNKIYDRRRVKTQEYIQEFLWHVEDIIQDEEEGFADRGEDEDLGTDKESSGSSSGTETDDYYGETDDYRGEADDYRGEADDYYGEEELNEDSYNLGREVEVDEGSYDEIDEDAYRSHEHLARRGYK